MLGVKNEITVPYVAEVDEDGVWSAHALLDYNVGANGQGDTREEAVEDLREALAALIEVVGVPDTITVTIDVP
jgi:predicted RNase H-like HicB family nuclease